MSHSDALYQARPVDFYDDPLISEFGATSSPNTWRAQFNPVILFHDLLLVGFSDRAIVHQLTISLFSRGSLRNNEAFFFTTGTGAVSYPSVQLNGSGELVSHTDSSAPRPSASRGTTGRATASRGAANSDRRSGTDWRELVDLRSGGGRRSTISVTVDLPRGPRDVEDLRSVREQEEHGEGVDKRAGVHGSTRDTYEEACECGRRRKRRPSADG